MPPGRLLILGTSVFPEVVAEIAEESGWSVAGFVENLDRTKVGSHLLGKPIYWFEDLEPFVGSHHAVCALGTTKRRGFIEDVTNAGLRFASVVHPSAVVAASATIGEGTILGPGTIVSSSTHIGRHVIANRGVLIGHHTRIDDFVSLMPGANIAGKCRLGEQVYVGMGALVIDGTTVGRASALGAGAVLTEDLPARVLAVGVPARVIRAEIDPF